VLIALVCVAVAAPAAAAPGDQSPAGSNNFSCHPTAVHPRPLVLVHGLGATMSENWRYMSPKLAANGYCVFALTYGRNPRWPWFGGTVPIEDSAPELGAFVDRVLAATGAEKVDLVGHSEGTFMPQYWLKFLGGATKVDKYVALAPLYDGTTLYGVSKVRNDNPGGASARLADLVTTGCGSCPQFLAGSDMVRKLKEGGDAAPGVTYTTVMSKYDELVRPYTSGIMDAPGATNIVLQEVCPTDPSEHAALAFDQAAMQIVLNALDPAHAKPVSCR
jgi:triacylglycerol esterase/lipase EstA (alpha/beta hydrolase family)